MTIGNRGDGLIIAIVALYGLNPAQIVLAHQTRVMPAELENLAATINCEPITNYQDGAINHSPPFVYDVLPDPASNSDAAFLCKRESEAGVQVILVLAGFENGYPSAANEEFDTYGVRTGRVISVLEFDVVSTLNVANLCGIELWPSQHVPLKIFMKWPSNEWLGDVDGVTEYAPIAGASGDGLCPAYYYTPEGEWLWFMPD